MHIVGTEATLETLSNYIIGSEGGTISALNGGSLVSDYSQTSVIIPSGSSAGWGSIASAWQLIAGEEDLKE
jgi:hypothetical protein